MLTQDEAISKAVNRAYDFAIETFGQIIEVEVAKAKKEMITAVLEIIDEEIYADEKIMLMEEDESIAECISRSIDSMDIIRRRVVDLKCGE